MALFTGKGDDGMTRLFDRKDGQAKNSADKNRISKGSPVAEALGAMDEVNSFLGLCKVGSCELGFEVGGRKFGDLVHQIQKNLFIIQAELAGADKTITEEKVKETEVIINEIERLMPPIKSFFISGGSELAAVFDIARTMARRAERRVVAVVESGERQIGDHSRAYLNRLSSILYALARLSNHKSGIKEEAPDYQ